MAVYGKVDPWIFKTDGRAALVFRRVGYLVAVVWGLLVCLVFRALPTVVRCCCQGEALVETVA